MRDGSKAHQPLSQPPQEHPVGSRLHGMWSIPRIRANGGGLRPPALGRVVKNSNGERALGGDGSICHGTSSAWLRGRSTFGVQHPALLPAPHKPHHELLRSAAQPAALSPQPSALHFVPALGRCHQREHLGPCWHPWQAPGRVAGPAAAAGSGASSTGCGAGGRLARLPRSPQRSPFLWDRIGSE